MKIKYDKSINLIEFVIIILLVIKKEYLKMKNIQSIVHLRKIYLITKKSEFVGILTIDKNGMVDEDSFAKFCYKWENISYIISGKYSFNIFFNNKIDYLRLSINLKDDLLSAIKKYSNVEIIDLATIK